MTSEQHGSLSPLPPTLSPVPTERPTEEEENVK